MVHLIAMLREDQQQLQHLIIAQGLQHLTP
jgi:hypothetical protein